MSKKVWAGVAGGLLLALSPLLIAVLVIVLLFPGTAAVATSCGPTSGGGGAARIPMVGPYTVTSDFGPRGGRLHNGIDLASSTSGTQIVAAAAGTVTRVGYQAGGAGNYVDVDIGGGIIHSYFHLAGPAVVAAGESVGAGQVLGIEGTTGNSTGIHLHFRVETHGAPTDPRTWFAANGVEVPPLRGTGVGDPPGPGGGGGGEGGVPEGFPDELAGYRGEQLVNAAWIIKAGESLSLDPWTLQVGVMTAMGESSLRVLDYGDDAGPDSRGLFQQRDSWGPLEVRMDPTGSSLLFFRALLKVPGYHTLEPTIAAHRTQRNADPYHYRPFWPAAVTVVTFFLDNHALLEKMPPTSGGATLGAGCKPFLSGVLTRQDLSARPIPRQDELSGFVIEQRWSQIEPSEGAYNFAAIQKAAAYAAANGMRTRLRIMPTAPEWVKRIGGDPVPYRDHDRNTDITIARFWSSEVQAKWQAMITALAAAFDTDPAIGEVNISGVSAYSAEDMLLQLEDRTSDGTTNREHLLAAGFTDTARDRAYDANVVFFQTIWRATATTLWVHPYRRLTGTDMTRTRDIVHAAYARNPHTTFGHTGADEQTITGTGPAADIYDFLAATVPFTLQSRSLDGGYDGNHPLGDLNTLITVGAQQRRLMALELPRGNWQDQVAADTITTATPVMAGNAAAWLTPPTDT